MRGRPGDRPPSPASGEAPPPPRHGAAPSIELLDHLLDRVDQHDGEINAVVARDAERARQRADAGAAVVLVDPPDLATLGCSWERLVVPVPVLRNLVERETVMRDGTGGIGMRRVRAGGAPSGDGRR